MNDKDFWPILVFRKLVLSFMKLFFKMAIPSEVNSKISNK